MNVRLILIGCFIVLFLVECAAGDESIGSFIWGKAKVPICGLYLAFVYMAGALCMLMIVYGGVKWLGGADDPGARKNAKDLVIHALVGLLILVVASGFVLVISGGELAGCESIT
jgi:hypothetical protein